MSASVRFEPLMDASGATERLVEKLRRNPPDLIYMALDPAPITHLVGLIRKSGIGATIMGGQSSSRSATESVALADVKFATVETMLTPLQQVTRIVTWISLVSWMSDGEDVIMARTSRRAGAGIDDDQDPC